jgi:hypothetical protein
MVELRKGLAIVRFGIGRPQVEVNVSVSGAGNTTIARRLCWNFTEAEGLHANQNAAMMKNGPPMVGSVAANAALAAV